MRVTITRSTYEALRECAQEVGADMVLNWRPVRGEQKCVALVAQRLTDLVRFTIRVMESVSTLPAELGECVANFVDSVNEVPTLIGGVGHAQVYYWAFIVVEPEEEP